MSLKDRFSDEKLKIFTLYNLHPKKNETNERPKMHRKY